jgi:hypothetical protein
MFNDCICQLNRLSVMQGPVAIILISWNVIFIWETGYWTRVIKRFALFDLLKSLYSDTKILSKYIPFQAFLKKWWVESDCKAPNLPLSLRFKGSAVTITVFKYRNKISKIVYQTMLHFSESSRWSKHRKMKSILEQLLCIMYWCRVPTNVH